MNACPVQSFPKIISIRLMTPDELWEYLESLGDAIPRQVCQQAQLTVGHQKVLLAFSHFMGLHAREELLERLASCPDFYAPLFYELADRAGADSRAAARRAAVRHCCADAAYMLCQMGV